MSFFKDNPIRDKKYTKWVATLPCADCGIEDSTIVPHHIIGIGQGSMGSKASDYEAMPLCYKCHLAIHSPDSNKDAQHNWVADTLRKAAKSGYIFKKS